MVKSIDKLTKKDIAIGRNICGEMWEDEKIMSKDESKKNYIQFATYYIMAENPLNICIISYEAEITEPYLKVHLTKLKEVEF